eukprot:gnl/MRDRNA2_/MRDRNA2_86527_c0_seq1.p1 gnl/MRDRNA2_/MRDRNA2_86527_c0~~gnl/MRDRNA2_/MRDRNA2_86527_c0_seq1.p1  ORF type:complete len:319 (+),score=-20.13 gnl/MRDRNA2_/MRDRNA2_86527_c0_seq1:850-1806(+)
MAYVCLLYPLAIAARLIVRFFMTLRTYPWPQALYLSEIEEDVHGLKVWDKWKHADNIMRGETCVECMPIITPTYPAMNSSFSVSLATRDTLLEEFKIAEECCKTILNSTSHHPTEWAKLLMPYAFFHIQRNFLKIEIFAESLIQLKKWAGFVHSRVKNLTNDIQHFVVVRPWPRAFHDLDNKGNPKVTYYLGISQRRVSFPSLCPSKHCSSRTINLTIPVKHFKSSLKHNHIRTDTMNISIHNPGREELDRRKRHSEPITSSISKYIRLVSSRLIGLELENSLTSRKHPYFKKKFLDTFMELFLVYHYTNRVKPYTIG